MLRLIVIAWLLAVAAPAHADSVALLPLDGEKRLEIYGQPVASELAKALNGAGVEVVVVGAKMAVPAQAKLIVDGTIKAKGQTVTLELRIRDARDGSTLESVPPSSGALMNIDKVAAESAARVVPAVKNELEVLAKKAADAAANVAKQPDRDPVPDTTPAGPQEPVVVVGISAQGNGGAAGQLLLSGLRDEISGWAQHHAHTVNPVEPALFDSKNSAPGVVSSNGGEFGMSLHVITLQIWPGRVPMARARVRLRVVSRERIVFDRVIHTDTIVGDPEISEAQFAARVARDVLRIAHANLKRTTSNWK
ncbi:MAG TPA: hypothetical protein VMZ53_00975 [Kofleriaceae bacterium]|nr:hypothetical protein [Kofleriaceae bacterium]